jgi:hypothetical protein
MWVGAVLAAFGILALAFQSGFHYTSSEKFPQDGATQVAAKQERVVSFPPVVGGLALAGGVGLMLIAARK